MIWDQLTSFVSTVHVLCGNLIRVPGMLRVYGSYLTQMLMITSIGGIKKEGKKKEEKKTEK